MFLAKLSKEGNCPKSDKEKRKKVGPTAIGIYAYAEYTL